MEKSVAASIGYPMRSIDNGTLLELLGLGYCAPIDQALSTDILAALGLVIVYRNMLILTQLGRKFSDASISERRRMLSKNLYRIRPFREMVDFIEQSRGGAVPKHLLFEQIRSHLSAADSENIFEMFLYWGVLAGVLTCDLQSKVVGLCRNS